MNPEQIEILDKAIDSFWNFQLTECESLLEKYTKQVPLFALLYTDIAFIKAVLTETKEDNEEATKRVSECKALARSLQLSQKPLYLKQEKEEKKGSSNGADTSSFTKAEYLISKLIYAETLVMKAIMEFKAQNMIKAGITFRKSWKQFYQAFEIVQTLPKTFPIYNHLVSCANHGVGIFHFLVSVVPPQYIWLVEGIGFKANRMEGIKEIKISAEIGNGIRSNMSKTCLILLYVFFFEDYKTPEPLLKELLERYPNGALLHYLSGAILRKQGNIKQSTESYESAFKSSTQLKQLQLFIESELGYNAFLMLDWKLAETYLSKFLKETTSSGFKAFIGYQLSCCYDLLDNKEMAMTTMKSLEPWVRKAYDFDEFSLRKSQRYQKTKGLSQFERLYLQAALLNEAHEFERSNQLLAEALAITPLSHDEQAAGEYLTGSNYHQMEKRVEARKYYTQALTHEKHLQYDHFVIPYSNLGLGEISLLEDKKPECKTFIKKAKSYNAHTYDFPSALDWRARKCLQGLGEF